MKLLSVGLARALWFLDVSELNPGGKDIFAEVVPSLIEDYRFTTYPKVGGDFKDGMKFSNGVFVTATGEPITIALTMWTDGIAADSFSSTSNSEAFLAEVLVTLPELGFAFDPGMVRRKAYLSQLTVKCSKDLNVLNPKLSEFASKLSLLCNSSFSVGAIEVWPDPTRSPKLANFSFQKKQGDLPSSDRYWSQVGLPTEAHLELLEEFESILS